MSFVQAHRTQSKGELAMKAAHALAANATPYPKKLSVYMAFMTSNHALTPNN